MSLCDKRKWVVADANNDSVLVMEEYMPFSFPWMYDFMHDLVVECALESFDTNKDGVIDLDEYAYLNIGYRKGG